MAVIIVVVSDYSAYLEYATSYKDTFYSRYCNKIYIIITFTSRF